jgi:hypothetical protein
LTHLPESNTNDRSDLPFFNVTSKDIKPFNEEIFVETLPINHYQESSQTKEVRYKKVPFYRQPAHKPAMECHFCPKVYIDRWCMVHHLQSIHLSLKKNYVCEVSFITCIMELKKIAIRLRLGFSCFCQSSNSSSF